VVIRPKLEWERKEGFGQGGGKKTLGGWGGWGLGGGGGGDWGGGGRGGVGVGGGGGWWGGGVCGFGWGGGCWWFVGGFFVSCLCLSGSGGWLLLKLGGKTRYREKRREKNGTRKRSAAPKKNEAKTYDNLLYSEKKNRSCFQSRGQKGGGGGGGEGVGEGYKNTDG